MTKPEQSRHIAIPLHQVVPSDQYSQYRELREDFTASWLLSQGEASVQSLLFDYIAAYRHSAGSNADSRALQALAAVSPPNALDTTLPAGHNLRGDRSWEIRQHTEHQAAEIQEMGALFLKKLVQRPQPYEPDLPLFLNLMIGRDKVFIVHRADGRKVGSDPRESFVRSYILLNKHTQSTALSYLLAETREQAADILHQKKNKRSAERLRTIGGIWKGFHPGQQFDPNNVTKLRF